jgi:hypothetical protein
VVAADMEGKNAKIAKLTDAVDNMAWATKVIVV